MLIESIQTYNFRNLTPSLVDTNHQHITLTGDNGQGKSNLLEAVYIICYGSSFRSRSHKQLIRFNEKEMSLIAQIRTQDRHHTVKLTIQDGKRRIYIDDTEISDRKALFSICTSIIFSHEDMDFVQGAPAEQRRFFDQTNSLINERYIDDLRMMNMIVKQRNAVLRQKDHSILAIYDQKLAESGYRYSSSVKRPYAHSMSCSLPCLKRCQLMVYILRSNMYHPGNRLHAWKMRYGSCRIVMSGMRSMR